LHYLAETILPAQNDKTSARIDPDNDSAQHSRAICDEIGERLRSILKPDFAELPLRLLALVNRLDHLTIECDVPRIYMSSIVPSLEEMRSLSSPKQVA
jgi:hypothetical protein